MSDQWPEFPETASEPPVSTTDRRFVALGIVLVLLAGVAVAALGLVRFGQRADDAGATGAVPTESVAREPTSEPLAANPPAATTTPRPTTPAPATAVPAAPAPATAVPAAPAPATAVPAAPEPTATTQPLPTATPRPLPTPTPIPRTDLLRAGGLGEFDFGATEAVVLEWATSRFGPPQIPGYELTNNWCPETLAGGYTGHSWRTDIQTGFGARLIFNQGVFVGWWQAEDNAWGVTDSNGLRIGSSRADLDRAYPGTPVVGYSHTFGYGDQVWLNNGSQGHLGALLLNGNVVDLWSGITCYT